MDCLRFNSIRNIIGLEWNIKVTSILPHIISEKCDEPVEIPEKTICSTPCSIKGIEGLTFSLELTNRINLIAKGQDRRSYQVIYAFAVVEDRAFLVKDNVKLNFLEFLQPDHLSSAEEITIHCMILVGQPMLDTTFAEVDQTTNKVLPADGQLDTDVEGIKHPKCKFDGEIPDFTDDNAQELIRIESTNSVLKVLAMEYLMRNIRVDNVSDILQIAVDQDLKLLMKHCSEFLSDCVIRRCRKSFIL